MKNRRLTGFTLIELLSVIAIIGVLVACLLPTVGKALKYAKRAQAANHLREIGHAIMLYEHSGFSNSLAKPAGFKDYCRLLAQHCGLNSARIWIVEEDPAVIRYRKDQSKGIPQIVAYPSDTGTAWELDPTFEGCPLSYTVVMQPEVGISESTTPIAWTRGLQEDGTWSIKKDDSGGTYGNEGGYILFMDGHINWYANLSDNGGQLVHFSTGKPTKSITEATGSNNIL